MHFIDIYTAVCGVCRVGCTEGELDAVRGKTRIAFFYAEVRCAQLCAVYAQRAPVKIEYRFLPACALRQAPYRIHTVGVNRKRQSRLRTLRAFAFELDGKIGLLRFFYVYKKDQFFVRGKGKGFRVAVCTDRSVGRRQRNRNIPAEKLRAVRSVGIKAEHVRALRNGRALFRRTEQTAFGNGKGEFGTSYFACSYRQRT